MKRIYHPYQKWEDYQNGMYDLLKEYTEEEEEQLARMVKDLLSNSRNFEYIATKVITEWINSAELNLSNPSRNRQAWIGQASCCYALKVPERITKLGWHLMTPSQQTEANRVADLVIKQWEVNRKCLKNTSIQMFLMQAESE